MVNKLLDEKIKFMKFLKNGIFLITNSDFVSEEEYKGILNTIKGLIQINDLQKKKYKNSKLFNQQLTILIKMQETFNFVPVKKEDLINLFLILEKLYKSEQVQISNS